MAYQSLYRRYRPRRFSDVRGQEHVVRALRNAVRDDKVGHAYLFTGPRGTGKTSTARILAKALNCEHLQDGEPDGTCESCQAIDAGTSYDVQELDAASNNGVSDVRDLIGRVNLGSPGRTKVYILDEVHMLTAQASAALLKTLEEPPAHVVFVLATTDPQKVLPTIKSRTQQYDFHLLPADELAEHVAWVIHDAGLELGPEVIDHVVRLGGGSARDTLSALDQVAAAGGVLDDGDSLTDLLDAVAASDSGRALVAVADAIASGRDPRVLGETLLARLRDVFLVRMGASTDHLPPGDVERVRAWADQLGDRSTTRALEAVGDALLEMRQAPDPRIPLEVALVKLTRVEAGDVAALAQRVARLEAALAGGGVPAAPVDSVSASTTGAPSHAAAPTSPETERGGPPPRSGRPGGAAGARAALAAARAGAADGTSGPGAPAPPTGQRRPSPPDDATPARPADRAPAPPDPRSRSKVTAPAEGSAPVPDAPASPRAATAPAAPSTPGTAEPAVAAVGTNASDVTTSAGGSATDIAAIERTWTETVLPTLGGLTKAMFSVGRFVSADGATAVLALPNEVHRQKCEQKRPEVEAALSAALPAPVALTLIVDDDATTGDPYGSGGSRSGGTSSGPHRPAAGGQAGRGGRAESEIETADDVLGGGDVHDLEDAPDAPAGGIQALTEAFPGAELLEGDAR